MQAAPYSVYSLDECLLDSIADELVENGYIVLEQLVPSALLMNLFQHVSTLVKQELMQQAGIGREQQHQLNSRIRSDEIRWLGDSPQELFYLNLMEQLRQGLNRRLFLGLFDYECHFAHYAPGDYYKKHLDAFKGKTNRVLSTVCYLTPEWQLENGGELLIYHKGEKQPFSRVFPEFGKMVIFMSERFPHEVLPAKADRYSITGWFRVNSLELPDPAN